MKKKKATFYFDVRSILSVSLVRTEPECHADRRTFNRQLSLFVKVVARKMIFLKKKGLQKYETLVGPRL